MPTIKDEKDEWKRYHKNVICTLRKLDWRVQYFGFISSDFLLSSSFESK